MSKRRTQAGLILMLVILFSSINANAFFDALSGAISAAEEEAYEKFMMAKAVQELEELRDNYEASLRYYAMVKELNSGKGILPNIVERLEDIGADTVQKAEEQFNDDWIYNKGYGSDVDQAIQKMDQYASDKVRYAGQVFSKALDAQNEGEQIAISADSLDPKTTERMILKTQALQLQLTAQTNANMAQLLELNTRLYQLQVEKQQESMEDWDIFNKSIQNLNSGAGGQ